jgi:hypothetical protein
LSSFDNCSQVLKNNVIIEKIFAKEGSAGQLFTDEEMFADLTRIKSERPTVPLWLILTVSE